jgi:hypothetical protein
MIWRTNIITCLRRVTGAVVQLASLFSRLDLFKIWRIVVTSVGTSIRANGTASLRLTEFVTLQDSGGLTETYGDENIVLVFSCTVVDGEVIWTGYITEQPGWFKLPFCARNDIQFRRLSATHHIRFWFFWRCCDFVEKVERFLFRGARKHFVLCFFATDSRGFIS